MKSFCFITLLIALCASGQQTLAQVPEGELQCIFTAVDRLESRLSTHEECIILDHLFIVDYNDPILQATVSGPVVNTSRSFNIPSRPSTFNANRSVAALPAQGGKDEAILWITSVYEQIASGVSLSALAPSTNTALSSMLGTFAAVVMPSVNPQARAEQSEEEAQEGKGQAKPGEISADVEYETFTFVNQDGSNIAFRGAFERTTDSGGMGFGLRLAYSRVSFDKSDNKLQSGEATAFIKFPIADFIEVGGNVTGTINHLKTASNLNPQGFEQNINSVGFGPFASVRFGFGAGHMLAGGLMYQSITLINLDKELDSDNQNLRVLAYGAMAVFSVNEKLALSLEGFRMDNLEIEGGDDTFTVVHPQVHFYLSDSFGLILGYKTVLGIDDYDSTEFTLGSSVRF